MRTSILFLTLVGLINSQKVFITNAFISSNKIISPVVSFSVKLDSSDIKTLLVEKSSSEKDLVLINTDNITCDASKDAALYIEWSTGQKNFTISAELNFSKLPGYQIFNASRINFNSTSNEVTTVSSTITTTSEPNASSTGATIITTTTDPLTIQLTLSYITEETCSPPPPPCKNSSHSGAVTLAVIEALLIALLVGVLVFKLCIHRQAKPKPMNDSFDMSFYNSTTTPRAQNIDRNQRLESSADIRSQPGYGYSTNYTNSGNNHQPVNVVSVPASTQMQPNLRTLTTTPTMQPLPVGPLVTVDLSSPTRTTRPSAQHDPYKLDSAFSDPFN